MIPIQVMADLVNIVFGNVIHTQKADQERLNLHVQAIRKRLELPLPASKNNWELLDRMTFERDR